MITIRKHCAIIDDEYQAEVEKRNIVKKIRVLIVDDCSAVRDGLQSILRAYPNIEVVGEAEDGIEGLAMANPSIPSSASPTTSMLG